MANDLASYTALVQSLLASNAVKFPQAIVTTALRQSIDEYNRHVPWLESGTIIAVVNQQDYSLSALTGLVFPYDVLNDAGLPIAFVPYRQDGTIPYIFINPAQPAGKLITVRYTKLNTLKDLDSAAATTIRTDHTNLIVAGAVGFSLQVRMSIFLEGDNLDPAILENYRSLSDKYLNQFYAQLAGMIQEQGVQKEPGSDTRTWEDQYHNWPS